MNTPPAVGSDTSRKLTRCNAGDAEEVGARDAQEAHGHEADEQRDDDRHETVVAGSSGGPWGGRADRCTTALSNTTAIMPGMLTPGSFSAMPSTATITNASIVGRAGRDRCASETAQ